MHAKCPPIRRDSQRAPPGTYRTMVFTTPESQERSAIVFDCSAKFMGKSLNDMLYKGPDQTSSLVGVLLRFRAERVAVMADIESMFHQVRVPVPESSFLRFLCWEDGNMARELQQYHMVVHLVGAILLQACANLALRKTAEDNHHSFPPKVVNTVKRNFYVDDCLKSLPAEQKAVRKFAVDALYFHVVVSS